MTVPDEIGEIFEKMIADKVKTYKELSEISNVAIGCISNILTGSRRVSLYKIFKLADVLGIKNIKELVDNHYSTINHDNASKENVSLNDEIIDYIKANLGSKDFCALVKNLQKIQKKISLSVY